MTIENEELDESALFENAVSDEPEAKPEPVIAEVVPEKVVAEGAALEAGAEKPVVDDNAPLVPSWRLREINAEKQTLADKVKSLEEERLNWQRQQPKPEPTKEEQAAAKPAKPDPLLDPDGYEAHIKKEIREELLNDRRESSLANAHKTYKAEFEEAYAAAQKQVDPALKARMQQSRDPGETLVEWHREQKAKAEVGTDLTAYKAKLREEALKDPEFRKAAMEAWRAEGQPQNNGRPRVDLPPSLNGASRSNAALRPGNDDVSDAELFEQTTG